MTRRFRFELEKGARRFRYQLGQIGFRIGRNWLLRRILYLLEYIECMITCTGEAVTIKVSVRTHRTFIRSSEPLATRTLVRNAGSVRVTIYENGKIVAVIDPGLTVRLPLSGRLTLEAEADTEGDIFVTTERRCPCGDEIMPPYGKAINPIGGDIL